MDKTSWKYSKSTLPYSGKTSLLLKPTRCKPELAFDVDHEVAGPDGVDPDPDPTGKKKKTDPTLVKKPRFGSYLIST